MGSSGFQEEATTRIQDVFEKDDFERTHRTSEYIFEQRYNLSKKGTHQRRGSRSICRFSLDPWGTCRMCTNGCRTFLWRGKGIPSHDEGDLCSCTCEDDSWSDQNILGQASCVPVSAHLIYGGVGLVASMTALFHALYHLRRMVSSEQACELQEVLAYLTRIEYCSRIVSATARSIFPYYVWYGVRDGCRPLDLFI